MNSPDSPGLGADELMTRIRAEVARRRRGDSATDHFAAPLADGDALLVLAPPALSKASFRTAERYALNDFLALHDRDFIEAAYRGVLRRRPDPDGEAHYLGALRRGDLSKTEILGRLRYSPEGRKLKVPVQGLFATFAVQHSYRIPVLGRCLATLSAILRLPLIVRNLQRVESYQHARNAEVEAAVGGLARVAANNEQALLHRIEFARGSVADSSRRIGAAVDSLQQRQQELDGHWRRIADAVDETQQEIVAATDRFMREATQDRAEITDIRRVLRDEIARNVAALAEIERQAGENATRLGDLETASRNHDLRLVAVQELEKRIGAAIDETNARIERRLLAVEAAENRVATLEAASMQWEQRFIETLTQVQGATQTHAALRDALAAVEQRLAGVQTEHENVQTARWRFAERLARLEGRLHEQSLLLGSGQTTAPERAAKKKTTQATSAVAPVSPRFEALYFTFEQRFRGTREEIRERLRYYLPLLRGSVVGKEGSPVLDIGCGRGEWLELLRDEKITARGIDINEAMIKECSKHDLDASVGDAIAQLKRLPDNSLGALTGFHIIEHVPLETLLELIEQAHRVVEPGGLVIFETPNPENIVVGACNFYVDPTHQRPLPPVMTQFLVESGGFDSVEIHRVNAHLLPKLFDSPGDADPPALRGALQFLQSAFACAPDYSVVGRVA
jgi:SAM-dependent methyltransferase